MKDIKVIIGILVGNTIYALAVAMFILPNDLITGGTTGIALFLNTTLNIPVTLFVSIFNICMFLLGWKILGKKFALTTLISSFYYPFILGILENIFKNEMNFRACGCEYLFKVDFVQIAQNMPLKPFKKDKVDEICKFYNENINSFNKPLFSRQNYQFFNKYTKYVAPKIKTNKKKSLFKKAY